MSRKGWIGVDLDGTFAEYDGWQGIEHIGKPIPAMLARVKAWLALGHEVRIFTARVCPQPNGEHEVARKIIEKYTLKHVGQKLKVTNEKDFSMLLLYDDRAVRIEENTGRVVAFDPLQEITGKSFDPA